jgi:C4-dicarboxylate-specific signal transduction histidine kinase
MDRGPGFSQDALVRAFDPFWSSEGDALGLGLPHARRLLAAQGALLSVANRAGGGGEATITLSKAG